MGSNRSWRSAPEPYESAVIDILTRYELLDVPSEEAVPDVTTLDNLVGEIIARAGVASDAHTRRLSMYAIGQHLQ